MNLHEAIRGRRSIGLVKPDPVDRAVIEQLLQAAVYAPNHYSRQPWRFIVMTEDGRGVLGRAYARIASEAMDDSSTEANQAIINKGYDKAFRAPVVITVAAELPELSPMERREDLAAVHAAVQNMLLEAHALGLGAIWRTGEPTYHPHMKQAFGLSETDEVVGFIYIGYPIKSPPARVEPSYIDKTRWLTT